MHDQRYRSSVRFDRTNENGCPSTETACYITCDRPYSFLLPDRLLLLLLPFHYFVIVSDLLFQIFYRHFVIRRRPYGVISNIPDFESTTGTDDLDIRSQQYIICRVRRLIILPETNSKYCTGCAREIGSCPNGVYFGRRDICHQTQAKYERQLFHFP